MLPFLLGNIASIIVPISTAFSSPTHRYTRAKTSGLFANKNQRLDPGRDPQNASAFVGDLAVTVPENAAFQTAPSPLHGGLKTAFSPPPGGTLTGGHSVNIKTFTPDHRNVTRKTIKRLPTNSYQRVMFKSKTPRKTRRPLVDGRFR